MRSVYFETDECKIEDGRHSKFLGYGEGDARQPEVWICTSHQLCGCAETGEQTPRKGFTTCHLKTEAVGFFSSDRDRN